MARQQLGVGAPSMSQLRRYGSNLKGAVDVIYEPLYDIQTYPASGGTLFTFFQNQLGVNGRSLAQTNLDASGQLPKGKNFLCTGIEVDLLPDYTTLHEATNTATFFENAYRVLSNGFLTFTIGSTEYARGAPLMRFPPQVRMGGVSALSIDGSAAPTVGSITYASAVGKAWEMVPQKITSNQNFNVKIQFDTAVPMSVDGRISVRLIGLTYRNAQ